MKQPTFDPRQGRSLRNPPSRPHTSAGAGRSLGKQKQKQAGGPARRPNRLLRLPGYKHAIAKAIKETFGGQHAMPVEPERLLGVVSLVFWTIMALVTVKYVAIIMRADNRGEGGSLALLALVTDLTKNSKATYFVTMLGIFAAALFYGDSMITPAISVLSAVEGLDIVAPQFKVVLPITIAVLCVLFWIQRRGTEIIGRCSGRSCACGSQRSRCWAS